MSPYWKSPFWQKWQKVPKSSKNCKILQFFGKKSQKFPVFVIFFLIWILKKCQFLPKFSLIHKFYWIELLTFDEYQGWIWLFYINFGFATRQKSDARWQVGLRLYSSGWGQDRSEPPNGLLPSLDYRNSNGKLMAKCKVPRDMRGFAKLNAEQQDFRIFVKNWSLDQLPRISLIGTVSWKKWSIRAIK